MNFKKMGKNLIWGVAIIFILWWVWRWVQGQGGILAAFNRFFPGMALLPVATPPTVIRPEQVPPTVRPPIVRPDQVPPTVRPPITREVEEAAPPSVRPQPYIPILPRQPAPLPLPPVEPLPVPGISPTDRLPWENNRKRSEVINALVADIARIERYPRELANTFTEVVRVGGVDNYLSMQRDRLTRARSFPSFPTRVGVVPVPLPAQIQRVVPTHLTPSPLTPTPEIVGLNGNNRQEVQRGGAVTRIWDESPQVMIQE